MGAEIPDGGGSLDTHPGSSEGPGYPSIHRWSKLRERYRDNDAIWLLYHLLGRAPGDLGRWFRRRAHARALDRRLPGTNTRRENRLGWNAYDWTGGGEEWNRSSRWRQSLIDDLMLPNLPDDAVALEIGPGAGRWTAALQAASRRLILADISERALAICRDRFADCENVRYCLTDGTTIPDVADSTLDFVWSYDVFVHVAPSDQQSYLTELARTMRPGARGVIHHSGSAGWRGGWRSAMTAEIFARLVRDNGMTVRCQFDHEVPGLDFTAHMNGDVITVFQR